ncbi:MAG: (d)CMP kinase [Armatimonadota bacterium]
MNDLTRSVIAIDGPAGAGKSTIAKLLARRLGLRYLDTGAMYRALALAAVRESLTSEAEQAERVASLNLRFGDGDPQRVFLGKEDVTVLIRTPQIAERASAISALGKVRAELVRLQQRFVAEGGIVLEGRDTTTVVAPNATLRVFLTASLEERARRRADEFGTADFEEVRRQIESRDHRDITRGESPLRVADGALVLESGGRTPDELVESIIAVLSKAATS